MKIWKRMQRALAGNGRRQCHGQDEHTTEPQQTQQQEDHSGHFVVDIVFQSGRVKYDAIVKRHQQQIQACGSDRALDAFSFSHGDSEESSHEENDMDQGEEQLLLRNFLADVAHRDMRGNRFSSEEEDRVRIHRIPSKMVFRQLLQANLHLRRIQEMTCGNGENEAQERDFALLIQDMTSDNCHDRILERWTDTTHDLVLVYGELGCATGLSTTACYCRHHPAHPLPSTSKKYNSKSKSLPNVRT